MKHVVKKALIGVAAALALVTGGVAAGALTIDSSGSQAVRDICNADPNISC